MNNIYDLILELEEKATLDEMIEHLKLRSELSIENIKITLKNNLIKNAKLEAFRQYINKQTSLDHLVIVNNDNKYLIIDGGFSLLALGLINDSYIISPEYMAIINARYKEIKCC